MSKTNNEIKLISRQTDKSEVHCETTGLEELIVDLLVEQWIEEQNINKDDIIKCQQRVSEQLT